MSTQQQDVFGTLDLFNDGSVTIEDPFPFFEWVRAQGPVYFEPHHGVAIVTGRDEAVQVFTDHETFSVANVSLGPRYGLEFEPSKEDISEDIIAYRAHHELRSMMFQDPPTHTQHRNIMKRLFTPRRIRENEPVMAQLLEDSLDSFVPRGRVEFISEFAQPFTLGVISGLLGVPQEDRAGLHKILMETGPAGSVIDPEANPNISLPRPLFEGYIRDRRDHPRGDVMTELATATFDDGSLPGVTELAKESLMLFSAGSDTTARVLGFSMKLLGDNPELQARIREERDLIPRFAEEMLRMEPPIKSDFRLARRNTTLAGVDIPAGTSIFLVIAAVNRDPDVFTDPAEFQLSRPNAQEHISFARGVHSCLGQALARQELKLCLNRILDRMGDIRVSEAEHGPAGARRYEYDKSFIMRGVARLHLEFKPLEG